MDTHHRGSQRLRSGSVLSSKPSGNDAALSAPPPLTGNTHNPNDQVAAAAASLQLLLREDPLLVEHGLTETGANKNPDQAAFPYAAALLQDEDQESKTTTTAKQRADLALQDVERKLALVESLAVKLSRTSPEAVAGHLLRLHGYQVHPTDATKPNTDATHGDVTTATGSGTTLQAVRERADRLERQSEVLETVAKRVEGSLQRGLDRMDTSCTKLERVLTLSSTLKMILRAQFENSKLQNYDLEDLRDLQRASASVAVLEGLWPELSQHQSIALVEKLRPEATATAAAVRTAANALLEQHFQEPTAVPQLGATLQVYFHLHELPQAVWKAVDTAHEKAEAATRALWDPSALAGLAEQARKQAKDSRAAAKKLVQLRLEAAEVWAQGVQEATTSVRNLQRVLTRKTDPESRKVFLEVVAQAAVPAKYAEDDRGGKPKTTTQTKPPEPFSLFSLFWKRYCRTLSVILEEILEHDNGKLLDDVAALYPPVRSVAKNLVGQLESLPASSSAAAAYEDTFLAGKNASSRGILGGATTLDDALLSPFSASASSTRNPMENPQAATVPSADTWTQTREATTTTAARGGGVGGTTSAMTMVVFQSQEWKTLTSNEQEASGIYPLQRVFVQACTERLCQPLQYLFPENIALNDDGVPVNPGQSMLPSKYDMQRFDENIRQELSLADPKEGGGELTAVTMIAECVVNMISQFCERARAAMSGASADNYLKDDWSMKESLQHDRKVAAIMYTLQSYLKSAPEKTFIAPYRPATSPQHEEAARLCLSALQPALDEINDMVKVVILEPLCSASNRRLASIIAKIHLGVYMDSGGAGGEDTAAFAQNQLAPVYEVISSKILTKFPPPYSSILASNVASFSIYCFASNLALVRPVGESARLHMTQDLADLELGLEQLVMKGGSSTHLSQIGNGKPYAELRAVRQMLFWNGLESKNKSGADLAKALLREAWIRDLRPSTILHYLFSYAPSLLSSPHHVKRVKAEEYAEKLVDFDGSEEDAWMTCMSCCDSYSQRATSAGAPQDGDARIAQLLMNLGPMLMNLGTKGHY